MITSAFQKSLNLFLDPINSSMVFKSIKNIKIAVLFLVLLLNASSLLAISNQQEIIETVDLIKAINAQLLIKADDKSINKLLETKNITLEKLIKQLKAESNAKLPSKDIKRKLDFLQSRITINTERGNNYAVLRDKIKLKTLRVDLELRQYLEYLIEASNNYQSIESVIATSQKKLDRLLKTVKELALPNDKTGSPVLDEARENHKLFLQTSGSYRDILSYVINNPRQIVSSHWFQEFSLLSAISYINHFDLAHSINNKLAPFKIDVGGVALSFLIMLLVYFSYPFVFSCTRWCVENFIIDKEEEQQELIYHEIRTPARTLLIFFGINLSAYALFYKTDYRSSLEGVSFIIYSLIFIWLLFRIVDSFVLVQIEKLTSSNKELRKELFNLAVKVAKGLIVIIILGFGLSHFGISLTAIISTLGVGGLAFALAAKDTLSNLFGGMTILFDNVFRMGDWIKLGDVEGTVAEIGLRSTTIRTFDNALITIPNSVVSVSSVMNWNRRAIGRRIKMYIGITYESDMDNIRQALDDIRDMLKNHPDIANPHQKITRKKRGFKFSSEEDTHGIKSTQLVFMDRYNDFSIDILIYCFTRTVNWAEWLAVKEDVLFKIADILKNNDLEFAYPTQVRIIRPENRTELSEQLSGKQL